MNCDEITEALQRDVAASPALLDHIRTCENCLRKACLVDGDLLFRSLGEALSPPGGVDLFAEEVMQQIHFRDTERRIEHTRSLAAPFRWGIAAALAAGLVTASLLNKAPAPSPGFSENGVASVAPVQQGPVALASLNLPVIEDYASAGATIVEVPSGEDLKVVMIFDETLPVDL